MVSPRSRHFWEGKEAGAAKEEAESNADTMPALANPIVTAELEVALESCAKLGKDGQAFIFPY